jgi:hypothetical protein
MKINKFLSITFLVIVTLFIQCLDKNNEEGVNKANLHNSHRENEVEFLDLPKNSSGALNVSSFADTVIYLPLETSSRSYIENIEHIWFNDSIIIVNTRSKLLLFQRNGSFVKQIGKSGSGPGEYGMIFNFDVINDTIHFSSTGKRSLSKYTLNGDFCGEVQIDGQAVYFNNVSNERLAWYHYEQGEINIFNQSFTRADTIIVEYGVSKGRYNYVYLDPFMTYFQKTSSGLLFNNYLSDTIWEITDRGKEPKYILNIRDQILPKEKQIEFSNSDFEKWKQTAKRYKMTHLISFQNSVVIFQKNYSESKISSIYIQNRKTKEVKKFDSSYMIEDMVSQRKVSNFIFTNNPNFIVAEIYPYELSEYQIEDGDSRIKKPHSLWLDLIRDIDKNDNPILVLIKVL